jgi:NAD(P)-dependent dehydrogenase (short-subunit alcohol dehydrogenase family)
MSDLRGKTVFITGASRGIGRAIATAFAAQGASVSICARGAGTLRREPERAGVTEVEMSGGRGREPAAISLRQGQGKSLNTEAK